jgi:signal transduction histidine kinase/ActR/RegA family two-component response regulator
VFYALTTAEEGDEPVLRRQAGYGMASVGGVQERFALGEGLVGQCALDQRRILLKDVPSEYVRINSGLGDARPLNIIVLPILFEGSVRAVVELASFSVFSATHQAFLDQLTESIGLVLNTIEANALTETLLEQSQSQAHELRARNQEVELAKRLVEEKAEQLALSSSYKSEFFANMSHELRTPLNSLLILARELQDNEQKNLTETQVQYASVIHSSGTDLLGLLNDILDLAKVESGTVVLEIGRLPLDEFLEAIERDFRPVADQQGVAFTVEQAPGLPPAIVTDLRRLRQVLKNLLANAFKFTDQGEVRLRVSAEEHPVLGGVTTFSIVDTGIGITAEMQQRMFEAFAQADGTTAREYGGTGLGLSISRELVRLLGGEITLTSEPERGSRFTVHLPPLPDPAPESTRPEPGATFLLTSGTERPPSAALSGRTALVIDDDFRNIFALKSLLERGGLNVVSAESGEEGLEILARTPDIDVVLVDIMMPVMDGYAAIRAMRSLPAGHTLPIVALTANVAAGESRRCIDAGASAYVSKPVDTDELLTLLVDRLQPALPTVHG